MNSKILPSDIPLVVDMDGTLTHADTTFELLLRLFISNPVLSIFNLIRWYLIGKGTLKTELFQRVGNKIDVKVLPYSEALFDSNLWNSTQKKSLISGGANGIVERVGLHLDCFSNVEGSTREVNLTSHNKLSRLMEIYPNGFDYVGDSMQDITVWKEARRAYGINISSRVEKKAKSKQINLEIISRKKSILKAFLKNMRLHQWAKNTLLFLILFLNILSIDAANVCQLAIAFVSFGLVASSTYILNDMLDIDSDRSHHSKKYRPLASSALPIAHALIGMIGLLVLGLGLAIIISFSFTLMLLAYTAFSLVYSFHLKRVPIIDTMTLSGLFCWRILTGAVVIELNFSQWFLIAMAFFFLSLATAKRVIELQSKAKLSKDKEAKIMGRGYTTSDTDTMTVIGIVSGFISIITIAIYCLLDLDSVVSSSVGSILLIAALFFWVSRLWLLVSRGEVDDDPIYFALKDKVSLLTGCFLGVILLAEQLL